MFGRKHKARRHTNIVFVIFRLFLSVIIFAVLLGGTYSAYKHFSSLDPLKIDPQAIAISLINQKILGQLAVPAKRDDPKLTYPKLVFSFMLVADSHNDNSNLEKAIAQAKKNYPDIRFIIGLGDYTDVGTLEELRDVKKVLDGSGLRYFVMPGDHDLWDSRNKNLLPTANFNQVFGPEYQLFDYENFRFVVIFNSDNYLGLGENQKNWLKEELNKAYAAKVSGIIVFAHEPLFHPSSDHAMGRVEHKLKDEAGELIKLFQDKGVKKVLAGDVHYFTEYLEPTTNLPMVTIGALTTRRNTQAPRYGIGYVFEGGDIRVEDVEIK